MPVVTESRGVMTLFSDPQCPYCHRVRMVLAEKKINIEVVDVDAENLPPEVLDANSYEAVPTLVDRDLVLYESQIIMEYLDERFPHPPLLPVDPVARANARLFMYRVDRDWYSLMGQIARGDEDTAATARKALRASLAESAPIFAAKPFFMSDEFSLVDCVVAPLLWRLPMLGVELPSTAVAVTEYSTRIFEWPSFRRSLSEAEREMVADLA
ncbi:MAG: glutathione S-transferase N-terminal domain-containing protein [Thiohalocapsa sp.]|uniref:glutathione S-transferase N-terminal domain-containing protein n=1 Tax=Thiohalocapsa sp. TaxID=2497641 RepID=UPI0025FA4F9D|nr:glutathione S-transferase N-terminal domain-containing protein [Thiohalocapsa sp.]MCG6943391.1 glutathione S-transferase N-terminal domain-containing protein [Thiohalocapsa sp.]